MLVGVVSDTHDNIWYMEKALDELLSKHAIEILIHLGDIVSPFTLRHLLTRLSRNNTGFIGIIGNNDGDKILLWRVARDFNNYLYEPPYSLTLDGKKILLLHGFGSKDTTINFVEGLAQSGIYDIILYGHTHYVDKRVLGKTLVVNPGELHGWVSGRRSYAVIDLKGMKAQIYII